MKHTFLLAFALLAIDAVIAERLNAKLTTEKTSEGYWVYEGGHKVLFYQTAAKSIEGRWRRANYVHPLFDLDGNEVTEDFPNDHRHHRGVFWAWHQCLVGSRSIGDGWLCTDFDWDVRRVRTVHTRDGAKPTPLDIEKTWRLRYRLLLHRDFLTNTEIETLYEQYTNVE
ncbi:MAG: DUF6807 family protein [Bythopirellula sp.]